MNNEEIKLGKYTILVVDDYPMNTTLVEKYISLIFPNAIIITAQDGKEAIESFTKHSPQIIIMDIQMPVMNGLKATQAIRNLEVNTGKHAIIIALTAGNIKGDKENCLESGMDFFMTKPIELDVFEEIMINQLNSLITEKITDESFINHFNKTQMMERVMNNLDLYNQMINMAIVSLPEYINELEKAFEAKYLDVVRFNACTIKGIALNSSFNILADYASKLSEIECNPKEENVVLVEMIRQEFEFIRNEIQKK